MKAIILLFTLAFATLCNANNNAPIYYEPWLSTGQVFNINKTSGEVFLYQAFATQQDPLNQRGLVTITNIINANPTPLQVGPGFETGMYRALVTNASIGQLTVYSRRGPLYCLWTPLRAVDAHFYRDFCVYNGTSKRPYYDWIKKEHNDRPIYWEEKCNEYICTLDGFIQFKAYFSEQTEYLVAYEFDLGDQYQILEYKWWEDDEFPADYFAPEIYAFENITCLNSPTTFQKRADVDSYTWSKLGANIAGFFTNFWH